MTRGFQLTQPRRASETKSLTQSVLEYEYENGRRYHAYQAGKYPMPNDEMEQERMDFQHHLYLMIFGGELYRAPLPPRLNRILDIGTGTGQWAVDFADAHPEAEVIATDLSVIQPYWVPPNLQFEIDDAEEDWQYHSKFDYIHIRSMGGSISDWPRLMEQAYDHLQPGGWIEVMDFEVWATTDDNSLPPDSAYQEFQEGLRDASQQFGKVMNISPLFKSFVSNAGFQDVREDLFKAPLSPWPRERRYRDLGKYMNIQMMDSLEPYSLALFTRVLKWEPERLHALLDRVRADLRNLDYHMYSVVYVKHSSGCILRR